MGVLLLGDILGGQASAEKRELHYRPAPIDNPLKGLVPYAADRDDDEEN